MSSITQDLYLVGGYLLARPPPDPRVRLYGGVKLDNNGVSNRLVYPALLLPPGCPTLDSI